MARRRAMKRGPHAAANLKTVLDDLAGVVEVLGDKDQHTLLPWKVSPLFSPPVMGRNGCDPFASVAQLHTKLTAVFHDFDRLLGIPHLVVPPPPPRRRTSSH